MTNSILIGKDIYEKLMGDATIQSYVEGRIFPLVAEQSTKFPFIVYWRNEIQNVNYTKDGYNEDLVEFTVVAASDKYNVSLRLANQIRKVLEVRKIASEDMIISNIRLVGIDESWSENTYIQTLNFTCTVN